MEGQNQMEEPFYKNGLKFSCKRCSFCCGHSPGFVYLSKSDLLRLCDFFKMNPLDFAQKYCRWANYYHGDTVLVQSMTTRASGIVSIQSSNAPMRLHSKISSLEVNMIEGRYHRCPKTMMAKKDAVHRRNRSGGVTSGAKALPLRSSR